MFDLDDADVSVEARLQRADLVLHPQHPGGIGGGGGHDILDLDSEGEQLGHGRGEVERGNAEERVGGALLLAVARLRNADVVTVEIGTE